MLVLLEHCLQLQKKDRLGGIYHPGGQAIAGHISDGT